MYLWVMCVHASTYLRPQMSDPLGAGVTGSWELSCKHWGLDLNHLWELFVFIATEATFQPCHMDFEVSTQAHVLVAKSPGRYYWELVKHKRGGFSEIFSCPWGCALAGDPRS